MSRSRKKPWITDNSSSKSNKKIANRIVRRTKEVADNSSYKRLYETWNICDWKIYLPDNKKAYRK